MSREEKRQWKEYWQTVVAEQHSEDHSQGVSSLMETAWRRFLLNRWTFSDPKLTKRLQELEPKHGPILDDSEVKAERHRTPYNRFIAEQYRKEGETGETFKERVVRYGAMWRELKEREKNKFKT